jgi:DNA (cytosine-5)-methyltransferase 1
LTHLSLFSGIGGIDLAAHWAGFETVAFVERDLYCQKVLAKNFPGVPIYDDVTTFGIEALGHSNLQGPQGRKRKELPERADERTTGPRSPRVHLLSGGFPCQPFSVAGKRKGSSDERFLWHEMLRVIREVQPLWVLGENVRGLLSIDGGRTFGTIVHELAEVGYRVGWGVYGACHVAAPHRRERVFIVGYSERFRFEGLPQRRSDGQDDQERISGRAQESEGGGCDVAHASLQPNGKASEGTCTVGGERDARHDALRCGGQCGPRSDWWAVEPNVGRVASRIPKELDGGGLDDESSDEKEGATRLPNNGQVRGLRGDEGTEQAPSRPNEQPADGSDSLLEVPCQGRPTPRQSAGAKSEGLHRVSQGVQWIHPFEGEDLRQAVLERDWTPERIEAMVRLWESEPNIPRVASGVPNRVDRLRALGNAVVPAQVYPILLAIADEIKGVA